MKTFDAWKYILPRGNLAKMFLDYQHKELIWMVKKSKEILKKLKRKER